MPIKFGSLAAGQLILGACGSPHASAQSLDDLNAQFYGDPRLLTDQGSDTSPDLEGCRFGAHVTWRLPLQELQVGALVDSDRPQGPAFVQPLSRRVLSQPISITQSFGQQELARLMPTSEHRRQQS